MLRRTIFATAVALALASGACVKPGVERHGGRNASEVRVVLIDYQHLGWGSTEERFSLVPAAGSTDFVLLARDDQDAVPRDTGHRVPVGMVQALLAAVSEPAWPREKGVRVVASPLKRAAVSRIEAGVTLPPGECSSQEIKRLARMHVKREGLAALVDEHYGQGMSWTDDYPHAQLQILFRSGPPVLLYSNSQKAMLLPWYRGLPTDSPSESEQDWSVELSQAMRNVLPKDSDVYERLGSARLVGHLRRYVDHHARQDCDAMRPRNLGYGQRGGAGVGFQSPKRNASAPGRRFSQAASVCWASGSTTKRKLVSS